MLAEMEQEMHIIKQNLKATQDSQKSYANHDREFKEFQFGHNVYFCINTKKNHFRIESCAKFAPPYCRPFKILERIGLVAYRVAMPPKMKFHDVFHVSFLKIYVKDVDHVIDWSVLQVDLEGEF